MAKPSITLLVDFGTAGGFGPGKAELLQRISERGSIAAAARDMDMSYRRAWLMVHSMNRCFAKDLVNTSHGGKRGGGARVTDTGLQVLAAYRQAEQAARDAAAPHLKALGRRTIKSKS